MLRNIHRFTKNRLILYLKTFFGRYKHPVKKYSVTCVYLTKHGIDIYNFG